MKFSVLLSLRLKQSTGTLSLVTWPAVGLRCSSDADCKGEYQAFVQFAFSFAIVLD